MTALASRIFAGTVVHKRLVPRPHAFAYRVFALCLDVDEIDRLDREMRLFSRGRFNVIGFVDRDYAAGDGATVASHARRVLDDAGLGTFGVRISLLSYPRILGYVFNPLSVYFCRDGDGRLGAIVYEVTNTFRERRSYVIPVGDNEGCGEAGDVVAQSCDKAMAVSPFTSGDAEYGFHVLPPQDRVVVGVAVRQGGRPVLKTHFSGTCLPFTDTQIARLMVSHPLLTLKVVAAIHLEAAKLWWKGVPLVPRQAAPSYAVSVVTRRPRDIHHG